MPPRVNIVVKPGWILERMAQEIARDVHGAQLNAAGYPPRRATDHDVTYYMPMKDVRHCPDVPGRKVGFFTHGFERSIPFVGCFDAHVTMNRKMLDFLVSRGAQDVTYIRPGVPAYPRPIVFGVAGRVYGKNRKRADLVAKAVAEGFYFVACSEYRGDRPRHQPPCRIAYPIEKRDRFYQSIDYLVVTSDDEGGPMPVLEAISQGVPVIAPDVGFCWEFPVIRYRVGDWESLRDVLAGLARRVPTWREWGESHRLLFERLTEGTTS